MTTINPNANLGAMLALRGHQHGHGARNAAQFADDLFARLDTGGQGYIKKSDLESAVKGDAEAARRVTGKDIDALFTRFDADGDGKLTKQEFTDSVKRLADQLNQQLRLMNAQGPDPGFTKDELTSQLQNSEIGKGKRGELLDALVQNFDKADSNGDGRIDVKEAMEFASNGTASSAVNSSAANDGVAAQSSGDDARMMRRLFTLLEAYGAHAHEPRDGASALQAVTA